MPTSRRATSACHRRRTKPRNRRRRSACHRERWGRRTRWGGEARLRRTWAATSGRPRHPAVHDVGEAAVQPALERGVVAPAVDVLVDDVRAVAGQARELLAEALVHALHQLRMAAVPQLAFARDRAGDAIARGLHDVFVHGLSVERRKVAMPVDGGARRRHVRSLPARPLPAKPVPPGRRGRRGPAFRLRDVRRSSRDASARACPGASRGRPGCASRRAIPRPA